MALALAGVAGRYRALAKTSDRQLGEAVVRRELVGVLDHVLTRSHDLTPDLDPRLAQLSELRQAGEVVGRGETDLVETLRQLLSSLGIKLDLPKPRQAQPGEPETPGTRGESGLPAASHKLPALYHPRKAPYDLDLDGRRYRIQVWPADARPNLNLLPIGALRRYLRGLGLGEGGAARLAGALVDWRDPDDFTSEAGAELDAYKGMGYRPRNGPFRSWQEVAYVKGVSPALVRLLRSHLVLAGDHRRVEAQYLTPGEIATLAGVSEEDAARAYPPPGAEGEPALAPSAEARTAIERVVTDRPGGGDLWLIRIDSGPWALQAVYRADKRRLLDWTLDGSGPIPAPPAPAAQGDEPAGAG